MKQKKNLDNSTFLRQVSLLELIERFPEKKIFFSPDEKGKTDFVTGKDLTEQIKIMGSILQTKLASQEKAILLLPQGLGYIYGLLACFYANVVAIPTPIISPEQREQIVEKITPIFNNSQAACIITNSFFQEFLEQTSAFSAVPLLNIEKLNKGDWPRLETRPYTPEDLALLLYTSGSTSQPKGVMLSHDNLLSQALTGANQWGINQESRIVSWMPQFHNFGLHFNILAPLVKGASSVILTPGSFLKDPVGWLKTIDQYQATHTAAPNFAFDLCYSLIDDASLTEISLCSLQAIVCGGEPIRKETFENFSRKFHNTGLEPNVFCPHYGLSEVGSVTTKKSGPGICFLSLDIPSLELGKIKLTNNNTKSKSVTSCGEINEGTEVLIVHSETGQPCSGEEIGEIWVKSLSVGSGYYRQEEETEKTFSGGYLHTGDLGFIKDNHLFIVGREKEVIIIHGKNHHPVDIEWTIKKYIPSLDLPISVFSCELNGQEKVIVIQEIETIPETDYHKLSQQILAAVSENHELELYEINLVEKGSIPKTGSGKVQRKACRSSYLNQQLPVLYHYRSGTSKIITPIHEQSPVKNLELLKTLKKEVFLPVLKVDPQTLEETSSFSELGLDSIQYVRISKQIEQVFQIEFAPVILFKHRSFEKLAEYLATQVELPPMKVETQTQSDRYFSLKNSPALIESQNIRERDIAIIGMSGHFPGGAIDIEIFWDNLAQQKDGITAIAKDRPMLIKDIQNEYSDPNDTFPQWGGFIDNVGTFDAAFFGISPMEAESMDPQQRKLLELTWSVVESSGYKPSQLDGADLGLFIGVHNNDYAELVSKQPEIMKTYGAYLDSGLHMSMIVHRVSRWFNFHGPSEVINTACSSSLVAIHHAVESICRGECNLAVAGGINLILTSRIYQASHKAGMLSTDGRCKTFDQAADGFVRAEGYGAVLLKPFHQAIKDQDMIYGVIKGAFVNHDGQSNSLRAPNLNAQKRLIKTAYQESGVPPETIGYIETHGTGTSLGDPIEIQALREAFEEINPHLPKSFCGLGTVKTNIGHCESAAGIAGLIKVLLSMRERTLPGILHFKSLNPYIQLTQSPFYIVEQIQEWKRFKNAVGEEIPRRAGISSFGFGGANAHVIIEEYIPENNTPQSAAYGDTSTPMIIVISAKNKESLTAYAQQLTNFLQRSIRKREVPGIQSGNISLLDIAYTLQFGREAMEERVAFLAQDNSDLISKLIAFAKDTENVKDCWRGRVKQNKELVSLLGSDEDSNEMIRHWAAKGKLDKIAQYWVQGGTVDWNLFYEKLRPCRISLPTYSFGTKYYWIPEIEMKGKPALGKGIAAYLHPLLHQNTSNFSEQRYSTIFTGEEFFLTDHIIKGQKILPGVVYLEMARAAVEMAAELQVEERRTIKLKNIIWARSIGISEKPIQVHIGLYPEAGGEIAYEIYSLTRNDETETVVYSQGSAKLGDVTENPVLDLNLLQAECNGRKLSGTEIYNIFKTIGVDYGPGHQGIEMIYTGQGLVLAKLSIPSSIAGNEVDFILHPSIMDAALQATIGMEAGKTGTPKLSLPFAIEDLEVYHRCIGNMWAIIQFSKNSTIKTALKGDPPEVACIKGLATAVDGVRKLDIDLCDEQGNVCVRMKGFSSKILESRIDQVGMVADIESLMFEPVLKEQAGLNIDLTQVTMMEQDTRQIRTEFFKQPVPGESMSSSSNRMKQESDTVVDQGLLREKTSNYLKNLLSPVIKLPAELIEADTPMEKYGIDSIMTMELTNQLEKTFGSLPKTLFFEYQTIGDLSEYFLDSYREQLDQLLEIRAKEAIVGGVGMALMAEPVIPVVRSHKRSRFVSSGNFFLRGDDITPLNIAIIGVSGRYPQARNLQEFWKNLRDGKDCITEIPKDRWDHNQYFDEDKNKPGKTYSKWGGFIDGVSQFDPLFFNISPREAEIMDPQERLFLECVYETLEDAGYTRETLGKYRGSGLQGNIGVYVGVMYEEYQLYGAQAQVQGSSVALSGNASSIANRVSYFYNFHGPSIAIDTMCSSSLTAIHLACQSIQRGGCELAIAGGVNISIHPNKYLALAQNKFASNKGRCESFGLGGDGYVPGEGVGAVLLKPLAKAITDGDQIYGVIKGTAINHGGKTNGYTVPNPNAQAGVIEQAIREAGINPRTISYIEAHGTGTSLGDPIEIAGLAKAFQKYTENKQFCKIGSAKSNIGHCESAAGIAGVTKVLLQLKNQQIVPSLHSEELNPNIDFSNTPFVVQQTLAEWERPVVAIDGITKEYPRIAGVSSFGAGGSNAHVVIEEYIPGMLEQPSARVTPQNPAIIVLSAKDEERIKEQVKQLLTEIRERQFSDADLANIAYTLQIGREAMEERLGWVGSSIQELEEKLKGFLEGRNDNKDLYRGQVKRDQQDLARFTADEEIQEAILKWIARKKYGKLIDLWVKGLVFDWNSLYGENKPRRISLPTYPFARECYWAPVGSYHNMPQRATIHPLLHQNTSDLSEQQYTSTFTGKEFFLSDHIVNGQKILPGAAYLEMARAAVEAAAGNSVEELGTIKLKNVVWLRPIGVEEEPVRVHIGLFPEDSGEIAYEIYNQPGNGTTEAVVYSEGSAILSRNRTIPVLDLSHLQAECNGRKLLGAEVYNIYRTIGLDYGPGHQGIETIYTGQGLALAKLSLPSSVVDNEEKFVLHPSIMDAAFQAAIGLVAGKSETPRLSLPFALEEIEVYHRCTRSMWAILRYSKDNTTTDKIQKLDIDICDEQGNVCVRLKGFTAITLDSDTAETGPESGTGCLMLEPVWKEQAILKNDGQVKGSESIQQLIILCEPEAISPESIETGLNGVRVLSLQSKQKSIAKRFEVYTVQLFETIQKILADKPRGKVLIQLVVASREEQQLFMGLSGILKTAGLENPKVIGQTIEVETMEDTEGLITLLKENSHQPTAGQVRYQGGKRQIAGWNEITIPTEVTGVPWKDGGVYLITGGAGGLGMIFAKEIAGRVNGSTLILTGRSQLNEEKQTQLWDLEAAGTRIQYRPADISDGKVVNELIKGIESDFGKLDGIIHSAGIIRDNYIIKKTKKEFMEVMAPKVTGLVYLDEASKDLSLDFMILFSSITGSLGNPGQADYAAANAFMDAFARYRKALVVSGQRQGRTLSLNWPLWQEGGMRIDETVEKLMRQSTGMAALRTGDGIRALYAGIASGRTQVMVMEGDIRQIRATFSTEPILSENTDAGSNRTKQESETVTDQDLLRDKVSNYLKKLLSPVIKLSVDRIAVDTPMEKYGIDSIMVMELTNELEKTFGSLPKTLFFEYQTIRGLSGYFLESHRKQLDKLIGIESKQKVTNQIDIANLAQSVMPVIPSRNRARFVSSGVISPKGNNVKPIDIAIIGVSGRYPQAQNLKEFWKNLRDGKDCITEIPKERWEYNQYYDEMKNKPGKTYSKWGGFIDGVDQFDPLFFSISPREAEIMDPQERLFLECVYETIEDAGYTRETLSKYQGLGLEGNVGVYVGVMYGEYQLYGAQAQVQGSPVALSGNSSAIANRVSYFCNFHGPSIAIDTMCSSSLTAIHLACQSIQRGGCELAIAGGVNISIHPNKYLGLGQGKFISSKGRCDSFGLGGDGYVPGEGVGAVLLKPLAKAIADGDQIYGVIKGTAINHGGKTNGYTVPNPNAQAQVIEQTIREAGIDPRTISYIEAHGTGTSLGDPIEIAGLAKVFQKYTENKQFCKIGSAKSNIGHCESAAGIAGVTKVLLQLKNQQIVPSLHSEELNPNIDFLNSPFIVQQTLAEWERPMVTIDGLTNEYPRIAGISSFGAGGSNAHVIIEEYPPNRQAQATITITPQQPALIILSAKNEARLKEQAERFVTEFRVGQLANANLADIAYTLQVGRDAMEERLGIITGSIEDLAEKLAAFIVGQDNIEDLYCGHVKRNQEALTVITTDEDLQKGVETWVNKGKYGKLLELWVKGLAFDWNKLYGESKPHRISLPTYPFARERYWVPEVTGEPVLAVDRSLQPAIHPLLHRNTSDLSEQRYSSTFTGREFFWADNIVMGRQVLPGVAYLEMARAAVESAAGNLTEGRQTLKFNHVIWDKPIEVGVDPVQVHIGLYPEENGEIAYEIYNLAENGAAEAEVYSQGIVKLCEIKETPILDLRALQAECNQSSLSAGEVYESYKKIGFNYEPGYRVIEKIYAGNGRALAKLSIPAAVAETAEYFGLHPSIMDGALQAVIGLTKAEVTGNIASVPFLPSALEELEIYHRCTGSMWALLQYSKGNMAADKIGKLDIDICDEQGQVCVHLKGFSARVLEGGTFETNQESTIDRVLLEPVWQEQTTGNAEENKEPLYTQHVVILCELEIISPDHIENELKGVRAFSLQSKQKNIAKRFENYALKVFEEIQKLLATKPVGQVLIQIIFSNREERQLLAGLSGLLKTARLENPKITGQLIEVETMEDPAALIAKLKVNSFRPMDGMIRYQNGVRQVLGLNEIKVNEDLTIPWKDGGVYLITGGAGGLGRIFANEITAQAKRTILVLAGRSVLDEQRLAALKELERNGAKVTYQPVDVTDRKSVLELIRNIEAEFGKLDGIIHSAGVIRDNYIIKKSKEEFMAVLGPKVTGLVNLDIATQAMNLDFVIFFASIAGSLGNPGQSDYATGNAFMDAYAEYRNNLVNSGQRQGRTLSISWPLWQDGGMRVNAAVEKIMSQSMGTAALGTATGIRALYEGIASGKNQVLVLEGNLAQMKQKLFSRKLPVAMQPEKTATIAPVSAGIDTGGLQEKVQGILIRVASKLLKVKLENIDTAAELGEYGFDSITLTEFINILNQEYGLELDPTIFFEYTTLHHFSEFLAREYQEVFIARFFGQAGFEASSLPAIIAVKEESPLRFQHRAGRSRFAGRLTIPAIKLETTSDAIAIVGMSGRFPQAQDLNEFWKNLLTEKDCITEIPKDRWNWEDYYGDPLTEANKTNIKWGGFIDGVAEFDPLFFGIAPLEAELMDPQQRLLMTYIWKAIEDAGYSAESLSGTQTGIFVGTARSSGYDRLLAQDNVPIEGYSAPGWVPSMGPNRMSYFLNIHGPSEPIETACSSSLVAIHRAVNAIENGNCEMAIAGGINIMLTPESYISSNKAGMLCEDGRCKTFSDKADGYVRGEGVGMLVFKTLKAAEEAGDHIYGIIRGTAMNHGGRANSLTAPNPKAQAELLQTAYRKAGIDPRTVTYIEAHGTGTALGDPIEINGLKMAFKELYRSTGETEVLRSHCGLGSVKTNIGHLELAAGAAGVIKVLLQLKHEILVKSLHCDTINPYIQLKDSPFYIVQEKLAWERLQDTDGREIPRRAGVSSFGFGGVNAHVVIEEYIPQNRPQSTAAVTGQSPALIVLSAKNEERLKEQARQLLVAIQTRQVTDDGLADMAYTLQVGREPMEERLALITGTMRELVEKLEAFLADREDVTGLFRGQVKRNKETLAVFAVDEDLAKTIDTWLSKQKYEKLLDLWVKGLVFDWNRVYEENKPRRISLPTYPFAGESYWVPGTGVDVRANHYSLQQVTIHPLLHQNTSTLSEQQYTSTFTGEEFFLTDHLVNGQKILPGVVYLEMARVAVEMAAGAPVEDRRRIKLKDIVWVRPVRVDEGPVQIHIGLYPEAGGEIAYEIYILAENSPEQTVVYSQGSARLIDVAENPVLDLSRLQTECNGWQLSGTEIYSVFKTIGLAYGPGHRGIDTIYTGQGLVLAKLSLPSSVTASAAKFVLHPSIMDAALQAAIGMEAGKPESSRLFLPFALEELEVYQRCTVNMWAIIQYSKDNPADDKVQKIDIDICDEQGNVCVRMKGLLLRMPEAEVQTAQTIPVETIPKSQAIIPDFLREKSTVYIKMLVGEVLKIPSHKIDSAAPLEKYGIDSILVVELTKKLSKTFANIHSALFFEFQTIDALVEHLLKTQPDSLMNLIGLTDREPVAELSINTKEVIPSFSEVSRRLMRRTGRFLQFSASGIQISGTQEIAIIGLSGRYPGADDINEYWNNLQAGRNCITEIPKERWDWRIYYHETKGKWGSMYTKWGGFIADIDKFDPLFFQISPKEAESMDPQERLFLEIAYASIEDAGYTPANLCDSRKVGVFVGVMNANYPTGTRYWSIANRISYLFNFQGPSMAVDTACSSSLTAIHLALESLSNGISDCAIAGGVNLIVDPKHYLNLSSATMLSTGANCKAFGDGADGFVDGEGVGAVILKPLLKAVADGDHIYGIIKGSMLNTGGKTNGYTVPNPVAQGELIRATLQRAGVHARTVSYVEAHGTGTKLGDPVEISGLNQAFSRDTTDKGFCAIGSVKSNIGHLEAASGISGLTKIIMQMKYRKIVPSLHSQVLSPDIDFSNTPFIVQQELMEWERPVVTIEGITKEYPRIAGLSSFGAGGSNVHLVIEEYIPQEQEQSVIKVTSRNPAIIVLSARNEERLKEQVRQLLEAIKEQQFTDTGLADIAYTLQTGREAKEERLALVVGSLRELEEKLQDFLEDRNGIIDLYRGQVKRNQDTLAVFIADEDWQKTVDSWIAKKKYSKILDLWVKGLAFDWNKFYGENKPRRISLPTYPFARESFWTSGIAGANNDLPLQGPQQATLHPLLHQNTSDFWEQRFSSRFTGEEFFISDHIVNGQKVLPGVASLEMARAAIGLAAGDEVNRDVIRLKDVVWTRPIVLKKEPLQIRTILCLEEDGEIRYEINGDKDDGGIEVYSQGRAMLTPVVEIPVLDLQAIQTDCGERIIPAAEVYQAYREMGIQYGPGHQGIELIYLGQEQVLAKISLPSSVAVTQDLFVLHPSMMDAALQASIGMTSSFKDRNPSGSKGNKPLVPFALKEVEVFERTVAGMWAWIRTSKGSKVDDKVRKLDIDLCDEQGKVCVQFREFSARVLEGELQTGKKMPGVPGETTQETQGETLMLAPTWDAVPIKRLEPFPALTAQVLVVGGTKEQQNTIRKQYPKVVVLEIGTGDGIEDITKKLEAYHTIDHILWVAPDHSFTSLADEALIKKQNQGVLQVFRMIKGLLSLGYGTRELGWSLITKRTQPVNIKDKVNPTHASLHGLAGSMAKEYPNWKIRLIDLESNRDWSTSDIFTLPTDSSGNSLIFRGGEWYRQQLIPARSAPESRTLYKNDGVYVVIGGAGGIGETWSEYVIRTYEAQVVWIGRREKDQVIQAKIDRLASLGPKPLYITADATKRKALEAAYREIKQYYPRINGIVHSAIVLLDKSLANMEEEQFQAGLSAKVDVSVRVAQVFRDESLDFVMFFSSMQSFLKAAGQSNYASGCTFKDAFAHQLNLEWPCPVKVMNWGYWGNVGIVASKAYRERMAHTGLGSIEPPEAMEALERLLAGPVDQIALLKTSKHLAMEGMNTERLITIYPENHSSVIANIRSHPILPNSYLGIDTHNLLNEIETALKQTAATILKAKKEDIDADTQLNEFGFDPMMSSEFINRLNQEYRLDLAVAILLEHPTIRQFAQYLEREYQDLLSERLMGQGG